MGGLGLLTWIIVGGLTGWLASVIFGSSYGLLRDIAVGAAGGLIGGFLFHAIGEPALATLSIWSVFVAVIGAAVLLIVRRLFNGRRVMA